MHQILQDHRQEITMLYSKMTEWYTAIQARADGLMTKKNCYTKNLVVI